MKISRQYTTIIILQSHPWHQMIDYGINSTSQARHVTNIVKISNTTSDSNIANPKNGMDKPVNYNELASGQHWISEISEIVLHLLCLWLLGVLLRIASLRNKPLRQIMTIRQDHDAVYMHNCKVKGPTCWFFWPYVWSWAPRLYRGICLHSQFMPLVSFFSSKKKTQSANIISTLKIKFLTGHDG